MQEKRVTWKELTPEMQARAREQYIYIRACEDEITEAEANKLYDTSDEYMQTMVYTLKDVDNEVIVKVTI